MYMGSFYDLEAHDGRQWVEEPRDKEPDDVWMESPDDLTEERMPGSVN